MKNKAIYYNIFQNLTVKRALEKKKIKRKNDTFNSAINLYEGRELVLDTFKSVIFPLRQKQRKGLKIVTPKQMLKILPVAFAQVKAGNNPENLLNEIR